MRIFGIQILLPKNRKRRNPSVNQLAAKIKQHEASGIRFYYILRNAWGIALAVILAATIFFEYYLAYKVGTKQWAFSGNGTFLNIVAGEAFFQVIGLCAIVVNSLFPKDPKK